MYFYSLNRLFSSYSLVIFVISLPIQIGMGNVNNLLKEMEEGICVRNSLEENLNICEQGNFYEFVTDRLKSKNGNDIFKLVDKNGDGFLDQIYKKELYKIEQEEFSPLISARENTINTRTTVKNVYFLLGKLDDEPINGEEFKSFLENGIKILNKEEFNAFIARLLSRNFISSFTASNFVTFLEKYDVDIKGYLDKKEQLLAAKVIFGFPRDNISWENISNSFEKLSSTTKTGLPYLDNFAVQRWINYLMFHTLHAHYDSYYQTILSVVGSDKNKQDYFTWVQISSVFSPFLDCIENWPLYEFISSEERNLVQPCKNLVLEHVPKLEIEILKEFPFRIPDSFVTIHEEFWKLADTDLNGYVTLEEQKELLRAIGTDENELEERREELLAEIDYNGDKVITYHELHQYFESSQKKIDYLSSYQLGNGERSAIPVHVYQTFKIFDEDLNGKINFKELRLTREIQNLYIRTLWIDSILIFIDGNEDGRISLKEFLKLNSFRKFNLPSDICPDMDINENYNEVFNKIDLTTDGYISKTELFELVKLISNAHSDELGGDNNEYLLYAVEELSGNLCSLIWHEFLEVIKHYGNEKWDFSASEKDFFRWDTNEDKWINFTEYSILYEEKLHWSFDSVGFVDWLTIWFEGELEYYTNEFLEDFKKQDHNNDGVISKGEIIKILQNHRKDYYTDERVNAKFTRTDRNEDGRITMAEYYYLTLLKSRRQS